MDFMPRHEFNARVRRYHGDRRLRSFSCRDQFLCLAFAQLTFRESLRDIETWLMRKRQMPKGRAITSYPYSTYNRTVVIPDNE